MEQPIFKLQRTNPYPERILAFGPGGAGKTTAVGTIAAHCPDATFWVADTDVSFAYERLVWTEVPFTEGQWQFRELDEWKAWESFTDEVITKGDPKNDWLVIDSATWLWTEVQSWFSEETRGVDVDEFLVQLRKDVKGDRAAFMQAVGAQANWDIINSVYNRKVNKVLRGWRGNVMMLCEADPTVKKDEQDRDNSVYAPFGLKPRGQKGIHYVMRTTLCLARDKGKYKVWTVKDQGREDMDGVTVPEPDEGGFAGLYLPKYGGWKAVRR